MEIDDEEIRWSFLSLDAGSTQAWLSYEATGGRRSFRCWAPTDAARTLLALSLTQDTEIPIAEFHTLDGIFVRLENGFAMLGVRVASPPTGLDLETLVRGALDALSRQQGFLD